VSISYFLWDLEGISGLVVMVRRVDGSETWPMKVEDMQRLERTEKMMIRWMCGVTAR
jgi:hypothetical protein